MRRWIAVRIWRFADLENIALMRLMALLCGEELSLDVRLAEATRAADEAQARYDAAKERHRG